MRHLFVSLACSLGAAAWAQEPVPLDGTWTAKWTTDRGAVAQAAVVVKGQEGTWQRVGITRNADPCLFRKVPVAVLSATAEEVVLELQRSKALLGCTDERYEFRRVDDKTLERALEGGQTMRLTR